MRVYSYRLIVVCHEGKLGLASLERIEMRSPASDPIAPPESLTGSWVDITDTTGAILYRQILGSFLAVAAEVESDAGSHAESGVSALPIADFNDVADIVIPDLREIQIVQLYTTMRDGFALSSLTLTIPLARDSESDTE